jgi:hypothetical protein
MRMEQRIFSDPTIPAGFKALKKPFEISPQRNIDNLQLIEFLVEGENIDEALLEIYSNVPVGILDFIKELKFFRSSIFALKHGRDEN